MTLQITNNTHDRRGQAAETVLNNATEEDVIGLLGDICLARCTGTDTLNYRVRSIYPRDNGRWTVTLWRDERVAAVASNYTIADLVELVERREGELAPGSETSVLSGFVAAYDCTQSLLEERGAERISDDDPTADAALLACRSLSVPVRVWGLPMEDKS